MKYATITTTDGTHPLIGAPIENRLSLKERQALHLARLNAKEESNCLHDGCDQCIGTGRKSTGELCFHFIACTCRKCGRH